MIEILCQIRMDSTTQNYKKKIKFIKWESNFQIFRLENMKMNKSIKNNIKI